MSFRCVQVNSLVANKYLREPYEMYSLQDNKQKTRHEIVLRVIFWPRICIIHAMLTHLHAR